MLLWEIMSVMVIMSNQIVLYMANPVPQVIIVLSAIQEVFCIKMVMIVMILRVLITIVIMIVSTKTIGHQLKQSLENMK